MAQGRSFLLKGVVEEEVDLVVGVNFMSCDYSAAIIHVMYSDC